MDCRVQFRSPHHDRLKADQGFEFEGNTPPIRHEATGGRDVERRSDETNLGFVATISQNTQGGKHARGR